MLDDAEEVVVGIFEGEEITAICRAAGNLVKRLLPECDHAIEFVAMNDNRTDLHTGLPLHWENAVDSLDAVSLKELLARWQGPGLIGDSKKPICGLWARPTQAAKTKTKRGWGTPDGGGNGWENDGWASRQNNGV